MTSHTEPSEISSSEWLSLNQFLQELKKINTQCISVYYPYGKGQNTIQLLQETNRSELLKKIEIKIGKKILELKKNPVSVGNFTKTLCIFGWIKNGKIEIKVIGTSKKLPYIYSQIIQESKLKIDLQGRHKKGGQSQGRFLRARQTKIHVFFKKVANKVRLMDVDSELILLGGNGTGKTEFYDELNSQLISKCRFVEGLSFTTSINDIHKIIIHHLYEYRKKHMGEFLVENNYFILYRKIANTESSISNFLIIFEETANSILQDVFLAISNIFIIFLN